MTDNKEVLDSIKEQASHAWGFTKEVAHNAYEKVKDPVFQQSVKDKTCHAWDSTKEVAHSAYEKAQEAKLGEKVAYGFHVAKDKVEEVS